MKLGIMQPYLFPYVGYFQLIHAVDKFILYDSVNYIKKGWINRNQIAMVNNGALAISVPVLKHSYQEKLSEVLIDNKSNWSKKLLNDIYYNYKKSDHFEEFFPILEKILQAPHTTISQLNCESLAAVADFLSIKSAIEQPALKYVGIEQSLMKDEALGTYRKTKRIIEICRQEGATTYVNAIGGKAIYTKEEFKDQGVDLQFLETEQISYKQFSNSFLPHLSIIDVIMHNGAEKTQQLLTMYRLI
jgi:hypothetical protein